VQLSRRDDHPVAGISVRHGDFRRERGDLQRDRQLPEGVRRERLSEPFARWQREFELPFLCLTEISNPESAET
jgi:hypothetical protein